MLLSLEINATLLVSPTSAFDILPVQISSRVLEDTFTAISSQISDPTSSFFFISAHTFGRLFLLGRDSREHTIHEHSD